jgi:hypothetical protein
MKSMNAENCYHVERVSNGYIVTEARPHRDQAMMMRGVEIASPPPHVFETYDAMQKWLRVKFEAESESVNIVQRLQP